MLRSPHLPMAVCYSIHATQWSYQSLVEMFPCGTETYFFAGTALLSDAWARA
jgi:hypothetical protein